MACDLRHVAAHEIDRFERALREKQQNRKSEGADSTRIYLCIYSHVCIYKCICIRTAINSCVRAFAGVAFIDAALFVSAGCLGSRRLGNNIYIAVYIFCDTGTSQLAPLEGSPQDLGGMGPRDLGDQGDLGSAISTFGVVQHILRPQFRESPSQAEQTTKSRGKRNGKVSQGGTRWHKHGEKPKPTLVLFLVYLYAYVDVQPESSALSV